MKGCFKSIGRRYEEKEDILIKNPFLNDYTKLLNSKACRRLDSKTQVFFAPDNTHVRTRSDHTREVIANSVTISEQLGLNTYLCIAIALGHDLGHCPDGHSGEEILSKLGHKPFKHYINGVVIAQHIERGGKGLNLTYETLDGILQHSRGAGELTINNEKPLEYAVIMFADKIAYTFSDLNDAIRYKYLCEKNEKNALLYPNIQEIPACAYELGKDQRERTYNIIKALVTESKKSDTVKFSESKEFEKFMELRNFMYEEIYPNINSTLHRVVWKELYKYFSNNALLVSLLTDEEANQFGYLSVKSKKIKKKDIKNFGVFEIIKDLERNNVDYKNIDYSKPDLRKEDFFHKEDFGDEYK